MNKSFTLQQVSRTGNLDSKLISGQYKPNLKPKFIHIKFENSKLKQSETADQIGYSSSTLNTYRNELIMVSLYRIQTNNTNKRTKKTSKTNSYNNSHREPDVKRPQMTSLSVHLIRETKMI